MWGSRRGTKLGALAIVGLLASGCVYTQDLSYQYDPNFGFSIRVFEMSGDGQWRLEFTEGDFIPGWLYRMDQANDTGARVDITSSGIESDGGLVRSASMTADGSHVAWISDATDLVAADTNNVDDVFVRDVENETTIRIEGTGGAQPNGDARQVGISDDGSTVVFSSNATNLVAEDTGTTTDVYRYRIATGALELISITAGGAPGSDQSLGPIVSADGETVAFVSSADDLVAGDRNGVQDVFVHDQTGLTRWSVGVGGAEADGISVLAGLSGDGTTLLFSSNASNLGAGTSTPNLWRATIPGANQRVSVDLDGQPVTSISSADLSDDGTKVLFSSIGLEPTVPGRVAVIHDAIESRTHLVSTNRFGTPRVGNSPKMSGDARYVLLTGDGSFDGQFVTVDRTLKASFSADVTSITPAEVEAGSSAAVTVSGDGFYFATDVATSLLGAAPNGVTFSNVVVVDSTTLTATVTVASNADVGPRDIHAELPGTLGWLTGTIAVPCRDCLEIAPSS